MVRKGAVVVGAGRSVAVRAACSRAHGAAVLGRTEAVEIRATAVLEATGAIGEEWRSRWLLLVWKVAVGIPLACDSEKVLCDCDEVTGNDRRPTDKMCDPQHELTASQ